MEFDVLSYILEGIVSIDDIASYCEVKDCTVSFGDSESGYVTIDGGGVTGKFNNYRRFLMLNELSSLPDPHKVLEESKTFRVTSSEGLNTLSREDFEQELSRFQKMVGIR